MSFWSNPLHSVTSIFTDPLKAGKNIAEAALPIAGAVGGGILTGGNPLGIAAGAELGGTGEGLLKGESFGQAAEGALPGAALSGVGAEVLPGVSDWASSTFPDTLSSIGIGNAAPGVDASVDMQAGSSTAGNDFWNTAAPATDSSGFTVTGSTGASGVTGTSTIGGAVPPAVAGGAPPQTPGFLDSLTSGNFKGALSAAGTGIANNPGLALAGAGMAANALKGNKETGAEKNQAALAGQQAAVGNSEIALGQSGQLSPGQQQVIENQLQQQISQIKSQYASMGMSGSTSEQAAIQQAQQQASASIASGAQQEITTGLQFMNQATQANQALVKQQMDSNPDLSAAILALNASSGVMSKKQAA